jgi:hypothetical protein
LPSSDACRLEINEWSTPMPPTNTKNMP